jgi:uracil-DNA glycosylase
MSIDTRRSIPIDEDVRDHMEFISKCRDERCLVPQKHPFYPVPEDPPFYYGKRPCLPVVPTWLCKGRVMILGMYPTCRYAKFKQLEEKDENVPVADIGEPWENSRYFDTYTVQDVRAATVLYEEYLEPLGLNNEDLWITNMVKCFLFRDRHVKTYIEELEWKVPSVEATRDDYLEVAKICFERNLMSEVELCKPKLVIGLGGDVFQMIHADDGLNEAPDAVFTEFRGKPLPADTEASAPYKRHKSFKDKNVFGFYHPSSFGYQPSLLKIHREQDLPAAKQFLEDLLWS